MIQGGDPTGTGMGGSGEKLRAEFNDVSHQRGICSMARTPNPDSADSQFFICLANAHFLDGQYTAWGQVISGMAVVDKLVKGDQIKLAEKRAETHGYRAKVYINSTPTTKGECRISQEFAKSDQRYYHVPCPHCGHAQRLVWERLRYKDLPAPQYQCAGCDQLIDESDKDAMVAHGTWVATVPQHTTRGYHLNALYSPFVRWSKRRDIY